MIRRLLDRLTVAHRCPLCLARLPRYVTQAEHFGREHYARAQIAMDDWPWPLVPEQGRLGDLPSPYIRAMPGDPDDGTGWSA